MPDFENKICTRAQLAARVAALPKPVVLTNGVFDILHRGHVTYLAQARALAAEALAAIEVLARLQGKGGERTEDSAAIDAWVDARKAKAKVRTDFAVKAQLALARILSEQSELRQLWEESQHYDAWRQSVDDLAARLVA